MCISTGLKDQVGTLTVSIAGRPSTLKDMVHLLGDSEGVHCISSA